MPLQYGAWVCQSQYELATRTDGTDQERCKRTAEKKVICNRYGIPAKQRSEYGN
jgi:hypothetical protein